MQTQSPPETEQARPEHRLRRPAPAEAPHVHRSPPSPVANAVEPSLAARRPGDRLLILLPFLVALLAYGAAYAHMQPSPTGDEPHYILYSHSLVFDGDADLANNYDRATIQRYFPMYTEIDPHGREYLGDGTLHSIHYLGLPVLISPIIAAGGGVGAVRALMVLLSAVLAYNLFRLLADMRVARAWIVWLAWAATALSLPLVAFSGQIFPELPGALLVVLGIRALIVPRPSRLRLALVACAAAVLPWLHFRFSVFMAGLLLGVVIHLVRRAGLGGGVRGMVTGLAERRIWMSVWPLLVPASSLLLLGLVTYRLYGSPWPPAMYVPELESIAPWSLGIAYRHGLGSILSPSDGWLPYAPVHWLGLVGVAPLALRFHRAVPLILIFLGMYFVLVAGPVWVGHSLPARYIMTVIPLVAAPLLYAIAVSRPLRLLFVPLLGLSLVLTSVGVLYHTLLYPDGSGTSALPVANRLQEVWPDFAADVRPTGALRPVFTVRPTTGLRQVGRLVESVGASVAYASPAVDGPGMLAYGPYQVLEPGRYVARFHLAANGAQPLQRVATVDVITDLPSLFTVLARQELRLGDLPSGGGYATVDVRSLCKSAPVSRRASCIEARRNSGSARLMSCGSPWTTACRASSPPGRGRSSGSPGRSW